MTTRRSTGSCSRTRSSTHSRSIASAAVGDRLVELAVDIGPDGSLVETEIEPTTTALAERLAAEHIELVDGQTAEVCLALDGWIASATAGLRRGILLLIDYGAPAVELYDPIRRRDGTLRAYVRHQVHDDPYRHVGRQDLTAHVDVTAVERAAHAAGLATIGITTQAEALIGLGIERRLQAIQADPATTLEAYTLVRSALMRLLDPAAMGRFRVMAFGRDWPAAGAGDAAARPVRVPPARTDPDRPLDRYVTRAFAVLPLRPPKGQARHGRRTTAPPGGGSRTCTRARRVPPPGPVPAVMRTDHGRRPTRSPDRPHPDDARPLRAHARRPRAAGRMRLAPVTPWSRACPLLLR